MLTSINIFAETKIQKAASRKVANLEMNGPRAQSLYYNLLALQLSGGKVSKEKSEPGSPYTFLKVKSDQGTMECMLENPQNRPLFDAAAEQFSCTFY